MIYTVFAFVIVFAVACLVATYLTCRKKKSPIEEFNEKFYLDKDEDKQLFRIKRIGDGETVLSIMYFTKEQIARLKGE